MTVFRFGRFEVRPQARELRVDGAPLHVEQQVFDVLLHLLANGERVVPKTELLDVVWGDRFVSESALTSRIKSLRRALDDSGERQEVIRTVRGIGYRFVAETVEVAPDQVGPHEVPPGSPGPEPDPLHLSIRFVEVDGPSTLAAAETGHGPTLVKAATFLTHVDQDTHSSPIWGHWVRALSRGRRYVRYDPRGCGLSDRDLHGCDLTDLDLWIDDLARVVDSTGEDTVDLLGLSQGGPVAIGYAVRHPERVRRLVLYGTYARGMRRRGDPGQSEEAALQVDLARVGWGRDRDDFRAVFARRFVPDAQSDEIAWFNDQLRRTADRTSAPQLEGAFHDLDATDLARQVTTPTLVLHATGDRMVPFEEGRILAGLVPGARFIALDSRNHILLQRDAAFARFVDEIDRFCPPAASTG